MNITNLHVHSSTAASSNDRVFYLNVVRESNTLTCKDCLLCLGQRFSTYGFAPLGGANKLKGWLARAYLRENIILKIVLTEQNKANTHT